MRLVRERDYFVCDYCSAFHFPGQTEDGVRMLGEASELTCPTCAEPLRGAAIDEVNVLHCAGCHGVLVRRRAMQRLVSARRAKVNAGTPRRPLSPTDLTRQVTCPSCSAFMDTHPYYGPGTVVIDSCGACGYIWLDRGEVTESARAAQDDSTW